MTACVLKGDNVIMIELINELINYHYSTTHLVYLAPYPLEKGGLPLLLLKLLVNN